jgi:putative membrane protein
MRLGEEEQSQIKKLVAEAESRIGAEVLVVIIGRADAYPEIPWRAFAIGAAFAALLAALGATDGVPASSSHPTWIAAALLSGGAAPALLAIFAPWFARLFLGRLRAQGELRLYAQSVYLERGVHATRDRVGVLILLSRFEREAVILADAGIRRHVSEAQLAAIAAQMRAPLARGRVVDACAAALNALNLALQGLLPRRGKETLADTLIAERGA